MRQKSGPEKQPAEEAIRDIRRATRRHFSAEERIRIVLEGLRGEESIAELCRREGIASSSAALPMGIESLAERRVTVGATWRERPWYVWRRELIGRADEEDETMRAVGLFTHGCPEVLQVVEVPEVHAGPGQVRIRVHAATVNPTDVMARNGARAEQQKADPPPYAPGMEAAGIADEVGSGVPDRLKVRDAVIAIVVPKGSHGAYREQIVLDARSVVRAPAGKTHAEAATLPMNGLTARLSLDLLKLSPGQVIAVAGSAGAYGGYVVQLKAGRLRSPRTSSTISARSGRSLIAL
jgi:hypothetical protein